MKMDLVKVKVKEIIDEISGRDCYGNTANVYLSHWAWQFTLQICVDAFPSMHSHIYFLAKRTSVLISLEVEVQALLYT